MKKIHLLSLILFLAHISFAQEITELKWWNPAKSEFPVIAGQAWPQQEKTIYHRLPERAEEKLREAVWRLSKQSAGLSIRFRSNANNIRVKYKLKGAIAMPHMPATGVSGLDLYGKTKDGEWFRPWGTYRIDSISSYNFKVDVNVASYIKNGTEFQLFLPLYNEVDHLEIGVEEEFFFEALPLRIEKPIVAYGTSICQGACASRPGMAWTNILERKLQWPVINLGFSGNGRLEPALIDLMTEIDAKVYILDCLPNLTPERDDTYKLAVEAVKKLKGKRPEVPVILTAHLGFSDDFTNQNNNSKTIKLNKDLGRAFDALKAEGFTKVYLLQKEDLGFVDAMFVDNIHPNDHGMLQYATVYEKLIRDIWNKL
ncbi:N-terminus of Esterase_SGNH_hydro-type [Arenibacter nanhaiticus]|uniref:N-terminus of Esterase_SGNH_hydro-type n=1 Tax=Arenibacter nanhaiticus TaxID=558155 RepID=A0A1M6LEK9_9FLAO|nr:SGNH/GDSL hydrolase family protein [Arenibacter nanhaiticus]SHJ69578.1 N-terminus of Esterase_SGNH_hydro-type [Arenibacter nanhaiticus]